MSLRQDVLRQSAVDLKKRPMSPPISPRNGTFSPEDSEDELVNVVSIPGTPARSRPASRPSSPTRLGASNRPLPGPLHLTSTDNDTASRNKKSTTDPVRTFPTEVTQRIFRLLSITDLATAGRVCRKWNKSQSINYVWFQHYRKENFHDESLPQGKWTKRESKQNWRSMYGQIAASKEEPISYTRPFTSSNRSSGYSTPSGYQTPREIREEKWKLESEGAEKPGKLEMREMYKELGGRKAKSKAKLGVSGASGGIRDRGGWFAGDDGYD